jgi:hypothetical protein
VRLLTALISCTALLLAACGGSEESQQAQTQVQTEPVHLDEATVLARNAAAQLTTNFQKTLKSELMSAISEHGADGAIDVCAEVAPMVTDSHSIKGWTIQRVSEKFRNPRNKATGEQVVILDYFRDTVEAPPNFYEDWTYADTDTTYHYYQPIYVSDLCLNCHGDMQTLAPGVLQAVRKRYPSDKAVGYKTGDLRGMFVVTARWPEAEAFARTLVHDSTFQETAQ